MFPLKEIYKIDIVKKRPVLSVGTPNIINLKSKVEGATRVKRCLFGKSNPEDTLRMLNEQREIDRRRFLERFGIDINKLEQMSGEKRKCQNPRILNETSTSHRQPQANRTVKRLKPDTCKKITDYYKLKKISIQEKENKP
ncbi:hypothetical protein WA026_016232 [Henosepilachna vigintioctopunctata]|uniref:Uncharacterized protein n=1 Tax=Henosepilachna vigintioctopunctata TaxID=420089 RepID=A0AAW1TN35_9CUCU